MPSEIELSKNMYKNSFQQKKKGFGSINVWENGDQYKKRREKYCSTSRNECLVKQQKCGRKQHLYGGHHHVAGANLTCSIFEGGWQERRWHENRAV